MENVLIVDDIEDYLFSLETYLEERFNVLKSTTKEDAMNAIDNSEIELAVLDIRLNEEDEDNREGLGLMKYLKEKRPNAKVIVMSAYKDFGTAVEALNEGADHFLQKPISSDELNTAIDRLLPKR